MIIQNTQTFVEMKYEPSKWHKFFISSLDDTRAPKSNFEYLFKIFKYVVSYSKLVVNE